MTYRTDIFILSFLVAVIAGCFDNTSSTNLPPDITTSEIQQANIDNKIEKISEKDKIIF